MKTDSEDNKQYTWTCDKCNRANPLNQDTCSCEVSTNHNSRRECSAEPCGEDALLFSAYCKRHQTPNEVRSTEKYSLRLLYGGIVEAIARYYDPEWSSHATFSLEAVHEEIRDTLADVARHDYTEAEIQALQSEATAALSPQPQPKPAKGTAAKEPNPDIEAGIPRVLKEPLVKLLARTNDKEGRQAFSELATAIQTHIPSKQLELLERLEMRVVATSFREAIDSLKKELKQ